MIIILQLSNLLEKEYDSMKEVIAIELKNAIKLGKVGIAVDLWSDKFRNISYLGVVAHYIIWNNETKTANLLSRVLKLQEMDANETKTANVVHQQIVNVLSEFDLQDNTDRIVFITDRGNLQTNPPNMIRMPFAMLSSRQLGNVRPL